MISNTELRVAELRKVFKQSPLHRIYGLEVIAAEGGVDLAGDASSDLVRLEGTDQLHGGAIAAMLDSAATLSLFAETGRSWTTVDLRVDYLMPARLNGLTVRGRVVRAGGRIGRARAELVDSDGVTAATGIGTFASAPPRD